MTVIEIKNSGEQWEKTSFEDAGDLLDYLLESHQIGKLHSLPENELTESRKKEWIEVEAMNDDDFIDIR